MLKSRPKKSSDAIRQSKRRTKLKEKFGPSVTLHMTKNNKIRLNKIAKIHTGCRHPGTEERCEMIAELINQHYIEYVFDHTEPIPAYIFKKYRDIKIMYKIEGLNDKQIAKKMNEKKEKQLRKVGTNEASFVDKTWEAKDVKSFRDSQHVCNLMKKATRAPGGKK
ncbi:hypothetical protein DT73_03005 [Mangrovibacter sp. MFB070]|uniref:hypothetical protein n=2 Tax=Mangrovibacter sp. MFB070 TaxID=1224318 RepID=UPI0004D5CDEF|nr:hypothetical protein [Mangrovibacter sp. MFB070]KEA53981.1 hypothetical protein DT73_03005 [Mangrovibacter sp. MFB070]